MELSRCQKTLFITGVALAGTLIFLLLLFNLFYDETQHGPLGQLPACKDEAFVLGAFLNRLFREKCWDKAGYQAREQRRRNLEATCNVEKSLLQADYAWSIYCSSLREFNIVRPTNNSTLHIAPASTSFSTPSFISILKVTLSYLTSFSNIEETADTDSWPISYWSQAYKNLTEFDVSFNAKSQQMSSLMATELAHLTQLHRSTAALLNQNRDNNSAQQLVAWENLVWDLRNLRENNAYMISQIKFKTVELLRNLRGRLNMTESFFPEKAEMTLDSFINHLPLLYNGQITTTPKKSRKRRGLTETIFKKVSEVQYSTKQGFLRAKTGRDVNWFAPGADVDNPPHQLHGCTMRALQGQVNAVSTRPTRKEWQGNMHSDDFFLGISALLSLEQVLKTVCATPIIVAKHLSRDEGVNLLSANNDTSCARMPFDHFFTVLDDSLPLSEAEQFVLSGAEQLFAGSDCAFLPWPAGSFKNTLFRKAALCRNSTLDFFWKTDAMYFGAFRRKWHNRDILLIANGLQAYAPYPVSIYFELCPASWNTQKEQCAVLTSKMKRELHRLDTEFPYTEQIISGLGAINSRRASGIKRSTSLNIPFHSSLPPITRFRREQRAQRASAELAQLLTSLFRFDSDTLEINLHRVTEYAFMNHKAIIELREATEHVITELRDAKRFRDELQMGSTMHRLTSLLDRAMDTQIRWLREDGRKFKDEMKIPNLRTRNILATADLGIIWSSFWFPGFSAFNSECSDTYLGLKCSIQMNNSIWEKFETLSGKITEPVQVFRYDNINENCLLRNNIPTQLRATFGAAKLGAKLSIKQLHRLFTGRTLEPGPIYVASGPSGSAFIHPSTWLQHKTIRIDPDIGWATAYTHSLFHEDWIHSMPAPDASQLIYTSTRFGFNLLTGVKRIIPIYTCLANQPILLSFAPGAHSVSFIRSNYKQCLTSKSGINFMYVAPILDDVLAPHEIFEKEEEVTPVWQLADPQIWNNHIMNLMTSIATAHLGQMRDSRGKIITPEFTVSWENLTKPVFHFRNSSDGTNSSISDFFSSVGDSIIETLDFTRGTRDKLEGIVTRQEERFKNLTQAIRGDTFNVIEENVLQLFSQIQVPLGLFTTLLSASLSIAFTAYKCRKKRKTDQRIKYLVNNQTEKETSRSANDHQTSSFSTPPSPVHSPAKRLSSNLSSSPGTTFQTELDRLEYVTDTHVARITREDPQLAHARAVSRDLCEMYCTEGNKVSQCDHQDSEFLYHTAKCDLSVHTDI